MPLLPKSLPGRCAAVLALGVTLLGPGAPLAAEGTTATDLSLEIDGEVRLVFGREAHRQPYWAGLTVARQDSGAALAWEPEGQDLAIRIPASMKVTFTFELDLLPSALVEATYAVPFTLVDPRAKVREPYLYLARSVRSLDGKSVHLGGLLTRQEETKAGAGAGAFRILTFNNEGLSYRSVQAGPGTPARPTDAQVAATGTPIQGTEQKVPARQTPAKEAPAGDEVAALDLGGLEDSTS